MTTMAKPLEQIKMMTDKELSDMYRDIEEEHKIQQQQRLQELRSILEDLGSQGLALQRRSMMGDPSDKEQLVIKNLIKHIENRIRDSMIERMVILQQLQRQSQSSIDQYSEPNFGVKPPSLEDEDEESEVALEQDFDQPMLVEQDEDQPMLVEQDEDQPMLVEQDVDQLTVLGQDQDQLTMLGQDEVQLM